MNVGYSFYLQSTMIPCDTPFWTYKPFTVWFDLSLFSSIYSKHVRLPPRLGTNFFQITSLLSIFFVKLLTISTNYTLNTNNPPDLPQISWKVTHR